MKWIRRGRQIGQAVKNVQRLRQIITVFSKYGFVDIVQRMKLEKFLPTRLAEIAEQQAELSTPERLRLAFEELGPTYVKLGQLLSTRPDIVPDDFIQEFTKLQDNVQPVSFEIVKTIVESELKKPINESYSFFDPRPLASASIAQVHEAKLPTGEFVVVKVQRPDIQKIIKNDIALMEFLAGLLETYVPETKIIGPKVVVNEFFRTLSSELDFIIESNNMSKMAANFSAMPDVVIPRPYKTHSSSRVLTQQKLDGIKLNDIKSLNAAGVDKRMVVEIGSRAFFKSIMLDGLFHGDLHGGNLFVLPGNRLGMIDFGIVGRLSKKSRTQLANMMMSLITEDYEHLCYQYAELGASGPSVDFETFERDLRNTIAPYVGLSMGDVNSGRVLIEATRVATKHNIRVPGDWMIVFKAMLTMEGMGRTLDPDFDLMSLGQELVKDLVKNQYSVQRLSKDLLWVSKDLAGLLQTMPRQIRWMMRKFNSNDFAFEIKSNELVEIKYQIEANSKKTNRSLIGIGFIIAAALSLNDPNGRLIFSYPATFVIFAFLGLFTLFRNFRS